MFAHETLAVLHLARQHADPSIRDVGGGFREHVSRVRERDFVLVGVVAVDVVEADGDLRHDLKRPLPRFENFSVDGSRSVVINPSMPLLTFSMINFFGGASGPW